VDHCCLLVTHCTYRFLRPPLLTTSRRLLCVQLDKWRFLRQLHIRGSQPTYQPTTLPTSTQHGSHPQKGTEKFKEEYSRGQESVGFAGGKHRSPRKSFSSIYELKLLRSLTKPHKTCKVRPIKAYRTLPSKTSHRKVGLSSRPSGGHSKVVIRVCGGWWVERNLGY
jgi:hypothetical protein